MTTRRRLDRALILLALVLVVLVASDMVVSDPCNACNYYPIDSWSYTFCRWINSCTGGGGW